jgi:hypothetical protein
MKNTAKWSDPVKGQPASEETLNMRADFGHFQDVMRKIVKARPKDVSPAPARS